MYQFRGAFEAGMVDITMKVSIGASGAPTLVSNQNKGIASIVRNSAGNYTINMQDPYVRLMMFDRMNLSASASAAPETRVIADNSPSNNIVIQMSSGGVATDPASGEVILMHLILKNSSVGA